MPALASVPAPAEDGDDDRAEGEQRGDRDEGVAEAGRRPMPPSPGYVSVVQGVAEYPVEHRENGLKRREVVG